MSRIDEIGLRGLRLRTPREIETLESGLLKLLDSAEWQAILEKIRFQQSQYLDAMTRTKTSYEERLIAVGGYNSLNSVIMVIEKLLAEITKASKPKRRHL